MNVRAQFKGQMLIDGEMVAGEANNWIESVNPANEERIGEFPAGDAADVNKAVAAAEKAQPAWGALDIKDGSVRWTPFNGQYMPVCAPLPGDYFLRDDRLSFHKHAPGVISDVVADEFPHLVEFR